MADTDELPDTYDGDAMRLMADIIGANSDSLNRITRSIQERTEAERDQYATMLVEFYDAVCKETELVTTRPMERLLDQWGPRIVSAARGLDRSKTPYWPGGAG